MKIEWNEVTRLSQVVAVVLFVAVFFVGFIIGRKIENKDVLGEKINSAKFLCLDNKTIYTDFYKNMVRVDAGLKSVKYLTQTISASGARYANDDESVVFWNKGDTAFIEENGVVTFKECFVDGVKQEEEVVQIANPASVNCVTQGGSLKIEKREDGAEYGLCYFDDNRACEEWAMMRGDCPQGGVKTTGFDTIDQKFCAWSGGQTLAVPNSICVLKNNVKCSTLDFYNGDCPVSE